MARLGVIPFNFSDRWEGLVYNAFVASWLAVFSMAWYKWFVTMILKQIKPLSRLIYKGIISHAKRFFRKWIVNREATPRAQLWDCCNQFLVKGKTTHRRRNDAAFKAVQQMREAFKSNDNLNSLCAKLMKNSIEIIRGTQRAKSTQAVERHF